jgi:hypothetical protein
MDFYDNNLCIILSTLDTQTKKINFLNNEINNCKEKIKNNTTFSTIQNENHKMIIMNKYLLLKKYMIQVIKYAISIHSLTKSNINYKFLIKQNNIFLQNSNIIKDTKYILNNTSKPLIIKLFNDKKIHIIDDIDINLKDIKKVNIKFISYIYYFNFHNRLDNNLDIINSLYIVCIYKKNLNKEFKLFYKKYKKFNNDHNKQLKELTKMKKNLYNNTKIIELSLKRANEIKKKFKSIEKVIFNQEYKLECLNKNFLNNIEELNRQIQKRKAELNILQNEYDLLYQELNEKNKNQGIPLNIDEVCSICCEDLNYGIITKCNHYYHYSCINLYIYSILHNNTTINITCPICRQYI